MKYVRIVYNSFLWAMTIATLCFKNEWLQMRVNTGLIFFGLLAALSVIISLVFRKKKCSFNWIFTVCNLAVCTVIGMFAYGFARMKVVPAALLREGIGQTSIPFSTINIILSVITAAGCAIILFHGLLRKKSK